MPTVQLTIKRVVAAVLPLVLTVFFGMLLDRRTVNELDAARSFIQPNPVRAGEVITITWSVIARRQCDGIVTPRVIESTERIFEYANIAPVYQELTAEPRIFAKQLTLPTVMASGPARYEAVVKRWCNWVQKYFWQMTDKPFPIHFVVE